MSIIQQAKESCRGEGWTVTGNRTIGYRVRASHAGDTAEYNFNPSELLEFAGVDA